MQPFKLGTPTLVCRWRLHEGKLPLESRHLRALSLRTVNGSQIGTGIVAWAKQHIEWTLERGAAAYPDGVLMLVVDVGNQAAMSAGAYRTLENAKAQDLFDRAWGARREAEVTGVSPEDLWLVRGNALVWGTTPELKASGSSSLIDDLAVTLGMTVIRDETMFETGSVEDLVADEVFLVSDEHGVVPAQNRSGMRAKKFAASYNKLLRSKR